MVDAIHLGRELKNLGLSEEAVKRVQEISAELMSFERKEKPRMKTTLQRVKDLEEISRKARELRHDLDTLDVGDWMFLDLKLGIDDIPGPETVPKAKGSNSPLGAHAVYMQRMLCTLSRAAANASDMTSEGRPVQSLGGRKPTLKAYAGYIAAIAVGVKNDGIKAGRGGVFERICELVFDSAGVPSKPEGALRYYMKKLHPEYLKLGHVL